LFGCLTLFNLLIARTVLHNYCIPSFGPPCILLYLCIETVECCAVHFQVPYSSLHPAANSTVIPVVRHWHSRLDHLQLTNSYGLFRRMTGVGGRPEVILEGSNQLAGPWLEYNFLYKPGNVNSSLPFVG